MEKETTSPYSVPDSIKEENVDDEAVIKSTSIENVVIVAYCLHLGRHVT